MKRITLGIAIGLMAIAAQGGSATADPTARLAGVRDCHIFAYYPNVLISSVRNMRCRRAAQDMRRYQAPIYEQFTTPGGFRCRQVSGVPEGGQWRCASGRKAYRFEFGD